MKKYLSRGFGIFVLGSLLIGATPVLALENPTTQTASDITLTSATLNGTNGDSVADAGTEAFWYGTTDNNPNPFVVGNLPSGWTDGIYATTVDEAANGNFNYSLTGLTPSTTYYYVAWVRVGGAWYPGTQESFTTSSPVVLDTTAPVVPTHLSPANDTLTTTALQNLIDWDDVTDPSMPVTYYYEVSSSNITAGIDNAFVSPIYTSGVLSISEIATPGTPDGVYYWHVRAVDNANNMSAWSAPWKITIDNTCTTDFDLSTLGSVNTKEGWSVTNPSFDQSIVLNTFGFPTFGCKTFRISNAFTSGSFGDQTFSPSNTDEAGETIATAGGYSGGTRKNHFESEFSFASTQSTQQPGLFISVSPDRGDGSRMSYLGFSDDVNGIDVIFYDVTGTTSPVNFVPTIVVEDLDRTVAHTAKFSIDYIEGPSNDIVKIYIDGNLVHTGTSWENYYLYDTEAVAEQTPRTTDNLIFRAGGTAVPANLNNGFIFDNFDSDSETKDPTPTTDPNPAVTANSATLHGINGEIDADAGNSQGFWYGPVAPLSPITSGINPPFPPAPGWVGGLVGTMDHAAGGDFEYSLTGLAPSTTYYYVAWIQVGGIWYPGEVKTFTTDANPQSINGSVGVKTYGDVDFDLNTLFSATSGLPITYTQTSPLVCTISGSTLHIVSAGTCTFNADQAGGGSFDPAPQVNISFNVTQKNLTVSGLTAQNKVYDRNTTATLTGTASLVGIVGTDNVTVSGGTAVFSDRNAANGKLVTVTGMTLGGTDMANYTLTQPSFTANITPRPITVTALQATKVYNGNNNAPILPLNRASVTSGNIIAPDFKLLWNATFDNKNVGTNKVMSVTPDTVNDGNGGANYTITYVTNNTSSITSRTLNVTAVGVNKVYDGNTTAALTFNDNRVSGDVLTLSGSGTFANKNIGTGKVVTVGTVTKSGTDANNYVLNLTSGFATANITPATLVPVVSASNKVYDTTTTASATCSVTPIIGDTVTCSVGSANFASPNIGSQTVTANSMTLSGPDAGNYVLSSSTGTTTATITKAPVTVSFTADAKVYDGNTSAVIATRTVTGNIAPDPVITATGGTAVFNNKNVGTEKAVTATGFTLSDSNYEVTIVTPTTSDITVKSLAVTANASDKVYDANTSATVTFSDDRVGGDVLTVTGVANFVNKNVGNNKTVNVTGISISGTDAGNYTQNTTTSDTADITPVGLIVSASAQNKQFDGNTTATVTLSNNAFLGDVVTQTYTTADFDTAAIGIGKTVTVLGITIAGADAGNYTANTSTATTANITEPQRGNSSGSIPNNGRILGASTEVGKVLGAEKFIFTQNMKLGSKDGEVDELQKFLNDAGYDCGAVDGVFGTKTDACVRAFQKANPPLKIDGIVGPLTRAVLNK